LCACVKSETLSIEGRVVSQPRPSSASRRRLAHDDEPDHPRPVLDRRTRVGNKFGPPAAGGPPVCQCLEPESRGLTRIKMCADSHGVVLIGIEHRTTYPPYTLPYQHRHRRKQASPGLYEDTPLLLLTMADSSPAAAVTAAASPVVAEAAAAAQQAAASSAAAAATVVPPAPTKAPAAVPPGARARVCVCLCAIGWTVAFDIRIDWIDRLIDRSLGCI
jgi:hypothetical protein